ncbi:MAG: hypothetical protein ACYC21_15030, partial [Eubacteriales bacterium]
MKNESTFTIILIILLVVIFSGCSNSSSSNKAAGVHKNDVAAQKNYLNSNLDKHFNVDPQQVEWLTMQGGLHITTKVIFAGKDSDKISNITNLINNGSNKTPSSQEEIRGINSRARPIGIEFKMKDGKTIFVWPSYKITTWKNGWSAGPRNDRFVLNIQRDSNEEYYTLISKDVPNYLRSGWRMDMPSVNPIAASPQVSKKGDKVVVAGDGCTSE